MVHSRSWAWIRVNVMTGGGNLGKAMPSSEISECIPTDKHLLYLYLFYCPLVLSYIGYVVTLIHAYWPFYSSRASNFHLMAKPIASTRACIQAPAYDRAIC